MQLAGWEAAYHTAKQWWQQMHACVAEHSRLFVFSHCMCSGVHRYLGAASRHTRAQCLFAAALCIMLCETSRAAATWCTLGATLGCRCCAPQLYTPGRPNNAKSASPLVADVAGASKAWQACRQQCTCCRSLNMSVQRPQPRVLLPACVCLMLAWKPYGARPLSLLPATTAALQMQKAH